jgi:long-chain acyl-CoA synthetase
MLMELLHRTCAERPHHLALACGDERLSHAQLVDRVERLAHGLSSRGLGAGDAVALLLPNGIDFVVAFHAITSLGAVAVPLNPQFKADELAFCFGEADVRAVVADDATAGVCARVVADRPRRVDLLTTGAGHALGGATLAELIEGNGPWRSAPRAPGEPATYAFSSGSTGRPKLVMRTHGQLRAEADSYRTMGLSAADRIFCTVPLFHTYGLGCCLLASAGVGAALVVLDRPNPFLLERHRAVRVIERERPTCFPGVPFHFRLLAEAPGDADLSSIRLAVSAGIALPRATYDAFRDRFGIPVRQLYGCTEAGTLTVDLSDDPDATQHTVGRPVGDVRVAIVDEDGDPLGPGEPGEVLVASPALTSGYAHLPELTAEAFEDGWFHTGDLGVLDDEGRLAITGRRKLLIEAGGYKVDPIEVQDVVEAHPAVAEAIVVGVPGDAPGEELVKAVVVAGDELDERELIRFCRERLANYKAPQVVELRDEIPRNPMGKVLRKYLV